MGEDGCRERRQVAVTLTKAALSRTKRRIAGLVPSCLSIIKILLLLLRRQQGDQRVYTHTYTHTHTHTHTLTHIRIYIHTYIHTYLYTYIHACIHI